MSPDTHWFLTEVRYLEEKKCIAAEFSSEETKRNERFTFFPSLLAPKEDRAGELIRELLFTLDPQKSKFENLKNSIKISASTYSDLKKIRNAIHSSFKIGISHLEPERQFLIEKNWSYFDCFRFSDNLPEKLPLRVPTSKTRFTAESLDSTIELLAEQDRQKAIGLADSIVLSNLLKIPAEQVNHLSISIGEIALENAFFKAGFPKPEKENNSFYEPVSNLNGVFSDVVEFDFSKVWSSMLGFAFFNLGVDSLNCDCCKPVSPFSPNVLPSSIVEVSFLQDAVYFESTLPSFSEEFHKSRELKEKRIKYMDEFFLQTIPVGPFSRQETAFVPIRDAQELEKTRIGKITGNSCLAWTCKNKESFISSQLDSLSSATVFASKNIEKQKSKAFEKHGIIGESVSSKTSEMIFMQSLEKNSCLVRNELFRQLQNPKSSFFHSEIAKGINAIKSSTIDEFRKISGNRRERFICCQGNSAFVKSEEPLKLAREFSKNSTFPIPEISKKHRAISFSARKTIPF